MTLVVSACAPHQFELQPFTARIVSMTSPSIHITIATPRALPKAAQLAGRVVVLDIAFASNAGGSSFEKVTGKFIDELGARLALWVDHHDSDHHALFANDARFVLHRKAQFGACPELVTPARVTAAGKIDSIVCHNDFDGLMSAAKWLRAGVECYPGADADAFAIDTCSAQPSELAQSIERSIRVRQKDRDWLVQLVHFMAQGAQDQVMLAQIEQSGLAHQILQHASAQLALQFLPAAKDTVLVSVPADWPAYDRTHLLLLGQQQARVAAVLDRDTLTFAANYNSGIDFLQLFGLSGGMPTVVSVRAQELSRTLTLLDANL
jgi:hypothetical protein